MSKRNSLYHSLLDKSLNSMLSAIELYNKPNFSYREEVFAILSVNAWELLLKAFIFKKSKYNTRSIYELVPKKKKDGTNSTRLMVAKNRAGNPKTISVVAALEELLKSGELPRNVKLNLEALIELRDNAIHFTNTSNSFGKQIQELGFACIKNYIEITKKWDFGIQFDKYNFYLMPLAYVEKGTMAKAVLTSEEENYAALLQDKLKETEDSSFDIAITIDVQLKKGNSIDGLGMHYDPNGVAVTLSEEDIRKRYPWTHQDLVDNAKERYTDIKFNSTFYEHLREVKSNSKLYHERKLDPKNSKSPIKPFYSTNVWQILDKYYHKKYFITP
ncbi:DUF3644 domain-containing protein [Prevotella histicola]|uniref:DUF3644 domain-containing protein n=1 Tax=Prevotella histicola TaxID=470565 RepID=UPI001CADDFEE|nr:DUF3644 domain-containing protein [Prevotella histicola]MBF1416686.1 DUF3644 domain-containing protein [Prevotella histicola]